MRRHILRDAVFLTVPAVALLIYLVAATVVGFHNTEIRNFHGYLTRNVRMSGPAGIARDVLEPLVSPDASAYMPLGRPGSGDARRIDLRVSGPVLDAASAALPGSAYEWRNAYVVEAGRLQKVQVRYRGQAFGNFFHRRKTWKIKTGKRSLIDGYRVINLTPIVDDRLPDHLAFLAARAMGLPASRTRIVRLYLNLEDQGLYLQEEQVDESMIRRCGRMPGDVFYGELSIPNEAKLGSNDLFWNPFLWKKKALDNRYPEEHRPHLSELLDLISDTSLTSFEPLYRLLARDEYALYFGLLSYYGDQHTDRAHNHKLFFNPLTGKFEGIIWNAMNTMPPSVGVESVANPLFKKLSRDPRFLDRVHRLMQERFFKAGIPARMSAEADRLIESYADDALDPAHFRAYVRRVQRAVARRAEWMSQVLSVADATFQEANGVLSIYARSATSLRLTSVTLNQSAAGARLFEDRDFDGTISAGDRELRVRADGSTLRVETRDALLFAGRDFRAPYFEPNQPRGDTFQQYRMYTRLAFLASPFIVSADQGAAVRVVSVGVDRTVGQGAVSASNREPEGFVTRGSIHPWRFPPKSVPRTHKFEGEVRIDRTLVVGEHDHFEAAPGTKFLLGPGVSVLLRCRVDLSDVHVRRADPAKPWGVFALQGAGCAKSRIVASSFVGGSHDTLFHVYYSGMVSIHYADDVELRDSVFADNLLGDDTVRFARCSRLRIAGCRVEGANGDAIDCDISDGEIVDTRVLKPRNDGIDLMTSDVNITRTTVIRAGDKGLSFGESASPLVRECHILKCVMGIGLKDGSNPTLVDVEISGCRLAISGYDKNWRYPGGGQGLLRNCILTGNGRDIALDKRSRLRLERCTVDAEFSPPADALNDGRLKLVETGEAKGPR